MIWRDAGARTIVGGCRECPGVRVVELRTPQGEARLDSWARAHVSAHEATEQRSRAITASQARTRRRAD